MPDPDHAVARPPATPATHHGAVVTSAARATSGRPHSATPRPTSAVPRNNAECSGPATSSVPWRTASCSAAHDASGQAAALRAARCSPRQTAATIADGSGLSVCHEAAISASTAAHAASVSSVLRSSSSAATSESAAVMTARTANAIRAYGPP